MTLTAVVLSLLAATVTPAKDPADAFMKEMLDAVKAGSYDAFVADGTPTMKSLGRSSFGVASAHFAPVLRKGYKTTYLARLRKKDSAITLWKLQPASGDEDFEVRVVVKDGKVDAFTMQ